MIKKKSKKEIEPKEKKSRAKYECPEGLDKYIYLFNLVPFSFELQSRLLISADTEYEYISESQNELQYTDLYDKPHKQEVEKRTIKKIFEKIPEKLARHITEYDSRIEEQLSYYETQYLNHLFLRNAVNFFAKCREVGVTSESGEVGADQWGLDAPAQISEMVVIDGKVSYRHVVPVGEILRGIEYNRLRSCDICEKIFWAKYKNSFTCSTPCLNALRQRRHRKTNKEAINEKRRANYRQNKKLKEIKEKKNNGTL